MNAVGGFVMGLNGLCWAFGSLGAIGELGKEFRAVCLFVFYFQFQFLDFGTILRSWDLVYGDACFL